MTSSSDSTIQTGLQRRPRAGTRNRGAIDALQTKIAVNLQSLNEATLAEELSANIAELPDAADVDAAFVCLISDDGIKIEAVHAAKTGFAQCSPEVLEGENLGDWPWLVKRLGHLRVIEVADTLKGSKMAREELGRLSQLKIGSVLIIGFAVHDEIAGFLAVANEQKVESWDANLHLLMKLLGASLASGMSRIRDQHILTELRERHELVALTANDGIWDFDGLSKHIELSPRWKRMLGYREDDEEVMLDWYNLVHPDDMARVQARMREHLEGKTPLFESVHRMKHQSGEWRWMQSRAKAVTDSNGRLLRLLGVEVDITERRLYEEALFREKESAQ
ncbi:MAG: PAS domain-containing protein, partial [Woeseiaceae bacterium]|nr:PAS domain-containing protein [Woeseiaceae bacterium]